MFINENILQDIFEEKKKENANVENNYWRKIDEIYN